MPHAETARLRRHKRFVKRENGRSREEVEGRREQGEGRAWGGRGREGKGWVRRRARGEEEGRGEGGEGERKGARLGAHVAPVPARTGTAATRLSPRVIEITKKRFHFCTPTFNRKQAHGPQTGAALRTQKCEEGWGHCRSFCRSPAGGLIVCTWEAGQSGRPIGG